MKIYRIGGKRFILRMKFRQSLLLDEFFLKLGFNLPNTIKESINKGADEGFITESLIKIMQLFLNSKDQIEALSIMLTEWKWYYRSEYLFNKLHKFEYKQVIKNKKHLLNCRPDEAVEVLQDFFTGLLGAFILPAQDMNSLKQENGILKVKQDKNSGTNDISEASLVTPIL